MEQSKNSRMAGSADRDIISTLPDSLLHHIMSFLTAYEAVHLCVLSKRWKNLWTSLPVLDFDLNNFENYKRCEWYDSKSQDGEVGEYGERERDYFRMFSYFVNMTLLLRKPTNLLKFRLFFSGMRNSRYNVFVKSWIRYALEKNPQVLDINICTEGSLDVGIFSCASLVNLSLSCYYRDHISMVNLPCLRRLYLQNKCINQDSLKKLLCGCPVLEFLHLLNCKMEFSSIHSQSLKYLKIDGCCGYPSSCTGTAIKLINCPNLLCFYFNDCAQYIGHKMLLNMPYLTCAIICVESCYTHPSYNGKSNILTSISSVRTLRLGGFWMKELLQNELPNLPEFQNVKDLSMTDVCLCLLASFLEHFPSLETLSFCHCSLCEVELHGNQESLKIAPFKCKHLHTVNVNNLCNIWDNDSHRVMKYLEDSTENLRVKINIIGCAGCSRRIWFNEIL